MEAEKEEFQGHYYVVSSRPALRFPLGLAGSSDIYFGGVSEQEIIMHVKDFD